jgi:hypothetical protein
MSPLNRHRDQGGQEERKKNNTLVRTLRKTYGENFADDVRADMKLGTLKKRLGLSEDATLNRAREELKK